MAFWQTRADERERYQKLGAAARLLYIDAGAWAMEQVYEKRGELPDYWFIPASLVREWGKRRAAGELVSAGLWEEAIRNSIKGYLVHCRWENSPAYVRRQREDQRDKKRGQRASKRRPRQGEHDALSPGDSPEADCP